MANLLVETLFFINIFLVKKMYRPPIRKGGDVHLCLTQTLILVGYNFVKSVFGITIY